MSRRFLILSLLFLYVACQLPFDIRFKHDNPEQTAPFNSVTFYGSLPLIMVLSNYGLETEEPIYVSLQLPLESRK